MSGMVFACVGKMFKIGTKKNKRGVSMVKVLRSVMLVLGVAVASFANMVVVDLNNPWSWTNGLESVYTTDGTDYGDVVLIDGIDLNNDTYSDVSFTLTTLNDVDKFYFNVGDFKKFGDNLTISGSGFSYDVADRTEKPTGHKADGDGFYDIVMNFDNPGNLREVTFIVSAGAMNLSVEDFVNSPATDDFGGNYGIYTMAAHLQNIDGNGASIWVGGNEATSSVPEPTTMVLLGISLLTLGLLPKRKK